MPIEIITKNDIKQKINSLYTKYIKLGCELELNISFRLRKEMSNKIAKIDIMDDTKLYIFYDNVIESMIKLMQDSYTRFRMTKVKQIFIYLYFVFVYI